MQITPSLIALCLVTSTSAQILFSESSDELGCGNIDYGQAGFGGGISFYDFNKDGWDDLTVSSTDGREIYFYINNNGYFEEIDLGINNLSRGRTVQWVDFDNDDDLDLFVTSNDSSNKLYENQGNLQFVDITQSAGLVLIDHISWGASWGDYDKDGFLDVIVTSRNDLDNALGNQLYKNNGDGTFQNVTLAAGISPENYLSFCAAFFDYNNDGELDIYISNDKDYKDNLLYENQGDGIFLEVAQEAEVGMAIDAMTVTVGDYNKDGYFDMYITNTTPGNYFLRNNQGETFTNLAAENGTLMETIAWGAVFLDADNDKDLDLYVSSSHYASETVAHSTFYENLSNGMYEAVEGNGFETDRFHSFSNAIGDLNNDGFPDIAVCNMAPHEMTLWENKSSITNNANWFKVKLAGVESNRQGIGSVIELSSNGEKQYNFTLLGEGYLGQNSAYEFFGIGADTAIDYVKVTWPSGTIDFIESPHINEAITIVEGQHLLVSETFAYDNLMVFPNPGSTHINLKGLMRNETLSILDTAGRVLFKRNVHSEELEIDITQFSSSVLFLKIKGPDGETIKRVIKH